MRKTVLPGDIFVFHNGDYSGALLLSAPAASPDDPRAEAQCTFPQLLKLVIGQPVSRDPKDLVLLGQDARCPGIRVSMEAVYGFVVQALEKQLISMLEQGVASSTREGVLAMISLRAAMQGMKAEACPAQPEKPGSEHVDYYSEEFLVGYEEGQAGDPANPRHPEGTQAWFNYREGWLMGDAEGKPYSPGA